MLAKVLHTINKSGFPVFQLLGDLLNVKRQKSLRTTHFWLRGLESYRDFFLVSGWFRLCVKIIVIVHHGGNSVQMSFFESTCVCSLCGCDTSGFFMSSFCMLWFLISGNLFNLIFWYTSRIENNHQYACPRPSSERSRSHFLSNSTTARGDRWRAYDGLRFPHVKNFLCGWPPYSPRSRQLLAVAPCSAHSRRV